MAKKKKTTDEAPEVNQDDVVTPPAGTQLAEALADVPSPQGSPTGWDANGSEAHEHAPVPAADVAAIVDKAHVHETPAAPLFAVDAAEPPPSAPQEPGPVETVVSPKVLSEAEQIAAFGSVLK